MESMNVSSILASTVRNFPASLVQETVVVGHNSHPMAAKLARLFIQFVTENWKSKCCYIQLSTPAICRYACAGIRATCGYWMYVQSIGDVLRADMIVLYPNRGDEPITLFHGVNGKDLSALSGLSLNRADCEYAPNYIANYFESLLHPQKKSMQSIRRARIRFAVGFDDPFYSRYVIRFLNSSGCKIVPLFQTFLLPDEVARTVVARRLSFGVILDDRLHIRSFVSELGEPIHTTGDFDVQGELIHSILLRYRHMAFQSAPQQNFEIDGMIVLLEILYLLSVSDTPISEYVKTNILDQMDQTAPMANNRFTAKFASFQKSRDT